MKLPLEHHSVCEVGFGGGFCLKYLQDAARRAVGIEQIPADLAHAELMGIRRENLYTFDGRPDVLPEAVSFWLFQDSFEHILDIRKFLEWMACNSTTDALLFVVAPDAGSLSRALLGRFWPHRLKEHQFHWSRAGITDFLSAYQFGLIREIRPVKKISNEMVLNHLEIHKSLRLRRLCGWLLPSFTLWFNIGEFGLLFRRCH